jgi:hypothetical protein
MPEGVGYKSPVRHRSPSWIAIIQAVQERIEKDSKLIRKMAEIQERYEGEYVMPLISDHPDLNLPPMSPAVVTDAIENIGNNAASVFPNFNVPQLRNREDGTGSKEWASIRRQTLSATWDSSRGKLALRRGCKQLAGYDATVFVIAPFYHPRDPEEDGVRVKVRSPLAAYPDNRENDDFSTPENCGFIFERSASWLRNRFPWLRNPGPIADDDVRRWRVIEWQDEHNSILGLMEPVEGNEKFDPTQFPTDNVEIMSAENRLASGPGIVCPSRVSLDRLGTRLSHITGIADLMSQLMLLEILSTENQIYPDRFVIGLAGKKPTILNDGGEWQAGRTGKMNVLKDVGEVGSLATPPPPQSREMLDMLERIARQHGHDAPGFRSESYGSQRTGRGLQMSMEASVNPVTQEIHETLEAALTEVNAKVLETWKQEWGARKFSLYSGSATNLHQFDLVPEKHIETYKNVVSYAIPGADIQAVTVQLGQLLATKGISLHTFRTRHPWIDDPEMEGRLTDEEAIEEAILAGILQQLAGGQMPLVYAAKIEKYRKTEPGIIEAILKADEETAAEQAALQEEQPPATDPAAMPGLAGGPEMLTPPGLPPESGMPTGPEPGMPGGPIAPSPDQAGLKQLINAVTAGQSLVGAPQ